jgi:GH18 family chitinase
LFSRAGVADKEKIGMADSTTNTKRLVGYFSAAASQKPINYSVTDIPADLLTHVIYAFVEVSAKTGECSPASPHDKENFRQLGELKQKHPHLRTLISVGGAAEKEGFTAAAEIKGGIRNLAHSCVQYRKEHVFDGIDIDWEFPTARQTKCYTELLSELRRQLDEQGKTDNQSYLLTIASPATPSNYVNIDLTRIPQYLDWINLMTYDFTAFTSGGKTGFVAPLYAVKDDPAPTAPTHNVDAAVKAYLAAAVPADKLIVGVRFIGNGWEGVDGVPKKNHGLYQGNSGPAQGTWDIKNERSGSFFYQDIKNKYIDVRKYPQFWHPEARVPWLYSDRYKVMISYEDQRSVGDKARYVVENNLGGMMIWELAGDDSGYNLTDAARRALQKSASLRSEDKEEIRMNNPKFNLVSISLVSSAGPFSAVVADASGKAAANVVGGEAFTLSATVQNLSRDRDLTASVSLGTTGALSLPNDYAASPGQQTTQPLLLRAGQDGFVTWTLTSSKANNGSLATLIVSVADADNSPMSFGVTTSAAVSSSSPAAIPTTTSVQFSPGWSGQPDAITATVTAPGSTPDAGSVQFYQNGFPLGSPILLGTSGASAPNVATYPLQTMGSVTISGSVLSAASGAGIQSVPVAFVQYPNSQNLPPTQSTTTGPTQPPAPTPATPTDPGGVYSFLVNSPALDPGTYSFTAEYSGGTGTSGNSFGGSNGNSILVNVGGAVRVLFSPSCSLNGQTLYLKSPGSIYVGLPSPATPTLPNTYYQIRACQVGGVVKQQMTAGGSCQPLSGVQVNLVDSSNQTIVDGTTTDAQGNFCLNPPTLVPPTGAAFVLQLPATVTVGKNTLVLCTIPPGGVTLPGGVPSPGSVIPTQTSVLLTPDAPTTLAWPFVYMPQSSTIIGRVTDGENGLPGIQVELYYGQQLPAAQGASASRQAYGSGTSGFGRLSSSQGQQSPIRPPDPAQTDASGFYSFSGLQPGSAQLLFPATPTDSNGAQWELQPGQTGTQGVSILAGQVIQAVTVAYQPEQHTIQQQVLMEGAPAENVLVDVRPRGAQFAIQSQRTGSDGTVTFVLPECGLYEVRVYPDPSASGGPQVSVVEVNSNVVAPPVNLPRPGGGGGGGSAQNGGKAAIDLQAYPVLTQDFSPGALPSATGPAQVGTIGGTSALGLAADKAIREVLSWRTKSDDPKGFVGALNQAFDLKEVEGHTEWSWTPRSYTVQTDLGAVTGAQASIYTRAKVALDQSMPLLGGLYALIPYVEPPDLATVQAVVRSQFTALVNEFGVVGGPRVPRVDELFHLLLGPDKPDNPERIPRSASLGLVRERFGLERRYVVSVDDEQNLTNYLILVDYVIGLRESWDYYRPFFIRTFMGDTEKRPFFGTQLVLMSRALEVVAQGVQDAYYTMDSVFMGDPERQTAQLDFANLQVSVPSRTGGGAELYTFPSNTSGLFVAELLDWVYRAASDELPSLLQDAGKDGLESFTASTDRLRKFVHAAMVPPQNARGLPPGYYTPRVNRALHLLADGLDEAYRLAFQIRPADFPAELTPEELRRIRQVLEQTGSGTSTGGATAGASTTSARLRGTAGPIPRPTNSTSW